jgi:hypothetical protein
MHRLAKSQFAALEAGSLLGRYHPSSHALDASRNPTKPGTFSRLRPTLAPAGSSRGGRAYRCEVELYLLYLTRSIIVDDGTG